MNNGQTAVASTQSAGAVSPSRRQDWVWKVSNNAKDIVAPAKIEQNLSTSPSRPRLADDSCCCPPPDIKICCCKGPCGSTTITEKKTKCGCCRTIETVNNCGCTKNTISKGPCGCCKTFERRDKCGSCEKRMEKVNQCGCCRMNLCIGPCGCTKTTETKTPTCCIKTHEAKSHCGCLNIRETKNKCGCVKFTECILPGGRLCRSVEERNPCGCKKCIENINKCKCTCCKLNVCVGPQGCCKTQVCKNPCMCYRTTEGHNKSGCCKVSEWKNNCGCLKISERRNTCGFGCKTTICKTPCGCRKIQETLTPCGCSTNIEGCNKLVQNGCQRIVCYKCSDCKTKCKCDDEFCRTASPAPGAAKEANATFSKADEPADGSAGKKAMEAPERSANASRAALYDLPQNPPGSPARKRRFSCDACEFCGGPVEEPSRRAHSASNPQFQLTRTRDDDSFLYDVYARPERRSGGESQPFSVASFISRYGSTRLNPFSLSNSLSRLSVMKLSMKEQAKPDSIKGVSKKSSGFVLTGVNAGDHMPKICQSCSEKGVECGPCHQENKENEVGECAEGCCCSSCSPMPCALGCCCPACCPALIVPIKSKASGQSKKEKKEKTKKEKREKHRHDKSKMNVVKDRKDKEHRHHKKDAEKKPSRMLAKEASKLDVA